MMRLGPGEKGEDRRDLYSGQHRLKAMHTNVHKGSAKLPNVTYSPLREGSHAYAARMSQTMYNLRSRLPFRLGGFAYVY